MIPKDCKRLAEVDFPIAEVSRHSIAENTIRHGHPKGIHLWWALFDERRRSWTEHCRRRRSAPAGKHDRPLARSAYYFQRSKPGAPPASHVRLGSHADPDRLAQRDLLRCAQSKMQICPASRILITITS